MSRSTGAPAHRLLMAFCSFLVFVSGIATSLHGQPASKPPIAIVDSATGSRALLYVDVVGTGANRRLVTAGVSPEGRQLGPLVFGLGATWSPDGTGFAYLDPQLALKFRDRAGQETLLFQGDPTEQLYLWQPAWSPDGKQIAVLTFVPGATAPLKMSIALVDVSAKKVQSRFVIPRGVTNIPSYSTPPNKFRWSADGRKILLSWESAAVLDTKTGAFELLPGGPILAEWAPAGDSVYYFDLVNRDRPAGPLLAGLYRTKLGSGTPPTRLLGPQELGSLGLTVSGKIVLGLMTLSPGGTKLAVGLGSGAGGAGKLLVYALGAPPDGLVPDKPLATFQTEELIAAIEWAPDETQLAVVAVAKDGVKIRAVNLATGVWRTLATLGPLDLNGREAEVLAFKALSWTQ
jgi:WD40 repeat protein